MESVKESATDGVAVQAENSYQNEQCKLNISNTYAAEEKEEDDDNEHVTGEVDEEQADERDENGPSYFEEAQRCEALLAQAQTLLADEVQKMPLSSSEYNVLQSCGINVKGVAYLLENEFANILSRYQESPHLLHPHLEILMTPLVELMVQYLPSYNVTNWQPCSPQNNNNDDSTESKEKGTKEEKNNGKYELNEYRGLEYHALGQNFSMFDSDAAKTPLHLICKAIYLIIKTAGEKACTSYFPNDVHYYEDVFYAIRRWQADDRHAREWEVKYCLLLWMSNLVLVPFALSLIDTSVMVTPAAINYRIRTTDDMNNHTEGIHSLSDKVLVLAMSFLTDHSKCRDAAAILLARLLTRPDSERHRRVFFIVAKQVLSSVCSSSHLETENKDNMDNDDNKNEKWQELVNAEDRTLFHHLCHAIHFSVNENDADVTSSSFSSSVNTNVLTSLLIAIAKAMKLGKRDEMKCHAEPLLPQLTELFDLFRNDTLLCKTLVKVAQRILLSLLRMHHASWRYSHHIASLASNLGETTTELEENNNSCTESKQLEEDQEEENNVIEGQMEHLEMGIALLLDGIGHKNTVVRWSAAKGIGRLCERLPLSFAQEVIHAIWDIFDCHTHHNNNNEEEEDEDYEMKLSSYHDSLWHGGLLSLAELCRRGLLHSSDLHLLTKCIARGLKFDVSKGTYSVGSHVRDAACYTCWSLARAYNPEDLTQHVEMLSSSLITTALFDREVHVRRAAAAAFQECVGRLGNFPHGIELITLIDFFSLASLTHAYESIAVRVAEFNVYTHVIVHELVYRKLTHWDRKIRELAARSLGSIAVLCVAEIEHEIIPLLLNRMNEITLASRHGAVLALAELIKAMPMDCSLPLHNRKENTNITCEQEKRGKEKILSLEKQVQVESEIAHTSNSDTNIMLSCNMWRSLPLRTRILEVITQLDSNRMFRARGGEHLRMACCKLLHAYATKSLNLPLYLHVTSPLTKKAIRVNTVVKLHEFIIECAKNILESVQTEAAITFSEFARVYYTVFNPSVHHKMIRDLLAHASHCSTENNTSFTSNLSLPSSVLERRGLMAILGGIPPAWLLASILSENNHENENDNTKIYYFEVIDILQNACQCTSTDVKNNSSVMIISGQEENDPETRRNAIHSLSHVFTSVSLDQVPCNETWLEKILDVFVSALNDYSVDRRGDVGSFVRIAALQELPHVLLHCLQFATCEEEHQEESKTNNDSNNNDAELGNRGKNIVDVNGKVISMEQRNQDSSKINTFNKGNKYKLCMRIVIKCLCNVLRLSMEKLDKVRAAAGEALCTLFVKPCEIKKETINTHTERKTALHWELMQYLFEKQLKQQEHVLHDRSQVKNNDENTEQSKEEVEYKSEIQYIKQLQHIVQQIAEEQMQHQQGQAEKHNPEYYKNVMLCNIKDSFDWHNPENVMERVGLPFLIQTSQTLECSGNNNNINEDSEELSCFAPSLVSGLIISAGDFSEHINKPARRVLQDALQIAQPDQHCKQYEKNNSCVINDVDNDVEREEKSELYYTKLSECVINVAQQYAHCERVLTPFTRAVDVLLSQRLVDPNVHLSLVNVLRSELKHFATCITFLLPATTLLANCCYSVNKDARQSAMQLALVMIASRYPKVRAKMATELYTALELLQTRNITTSVCCEHKNNDDGIDNNNKEEEWKRAIQILLTVQWDGTDAAAIRSARNSLYPLLNLTEPSSLAQTQKTNLSNNSNLTTEQSALEMPQASKSVAQSKVAASYKYLVREAGY